MATTSDFSVGLAHKFCVAAANAGFTPSELDALAQNEAKIHDVLTLVRGQAEIAVVKHIIDCDTVPFVPEGWRIEPADQIASRLLGKVTWDPTKVALFLADGQKNGRTIKGDDLRTTLEGKAVYTAYVLDYLIKNPHLIPEDWKGKATFFWGSIYRDSDGDLYVRYLYWGDGHWCWNYRWLCSQFGDGSPAAVSAS